MNNNAQTIQAKNRGSYHMCFVVDNCFVHFIDILKQTLPNQTFCVLKLFFYSFRFHCHSKKYFNIGHYSGIYCNYHIFSLKLDFDFFLTFYFQRNELKGNIQTKKLNSRTEIECLEL